METSILEMSLCRKDVFFHVKPDFRPRRRRLQLKKCILSPLKRAIKSEYAGLVLLVISPGPALIHFFNIAGSK